MVSLTQTFGLGNYLKHCKFQITLKVLTLTASLLIYPKGSKIDTQLFKIDPKITLFLNVSQKNHTKIPSLIRNNVSAAPHHTTIL